MNTVILTSVLSAGNHALFAGTRVLYGLSVSGQGPRIFTWTTPGGIPLPALMATSSISLLCFGSSFIGSGQLWGWLQNIVGVSNQVRGFLEGPCGRWALMGGDWADRLRGCRLGWRAGGLGRRGSARGGRSAR